MRVVSVASLQEKAEEQGYLSLTDIDFLLREQVLNHDTCDWGECVHCCEDHEDLIQTGINRGLEDPSYNIHFGDYGYIYAEEIDKLIPDYFDEESHSWNDLKRILERIRDRLPSY